MSDLDRAAEDLRRKGSRFRIETREGEVRLTDKAPPEPEPVEEPEPYWGDAELCLVCGLVVNKAQRPTQVMRVRDGKVVVLGLQHWNCNWESDA